MPETPITAAALLETAILAAQAGGDVLQHYFRRRDQLEVRAKGSNRDLVSRADTDSERQVVAEIRRRFPEHAILAEEGGAEAGLGGLQGAGIEWIIDPLDGTTNFLQGLPMFCVSIACRQVSQNPPQPELSDQDSARREAASAGQIEAAVVLDPIGQHLFSAARGLGGRWNERPLRVSECNTLSDAFLATGFPLRSPAVTDLYLDMFRQVFGRSRALRRCGAAALDLAYTAAGVYDGFFELGLAAWDIAAGALLVEEAGGRISDLDGGNRYLETGNLVAGAPDLHEPLRALIGRHANEAELGRRLGAAP